MGQRNCPNCGAPYKTELNTCPYCGTSYFDMSAIDINEGKPFYLKLKTGNFVFTSKVKVDSNIQIEVITDDYSACNHNGEEIYNIVANRYLNVDMRFTSVHDYNKKKEPLYTVEVKDDLGRS